MQNTLGPQVEDWTPAASIALLASVAVIAAVLVMRRWSGAFASPMPATGACAVATVAMMINVAGLLLLRTFVVRPQIKRIWPAIAAVAVFPPAAIALSLAASATTPAVCYAGGLIGVTGLTVVGVVSQGVRGTVVLTPPSDSDRSHLPESISPIDAQHTGDHHVTQWMTREIDPDGTHRWEGGVRIEFSPGQKQQVIHIPFSPPFDHTPQVECEVLDETELRLNVAAVYPYGTRIDVRRTATADALTAEIGIMAVAAAGHSHAA